MAALAPLSSYILCIAACWVGCLSIYSNLRSCYIECVSPLLAVAIAQYSRMPHFETSAFSIHRFWTENTSIWLHFKFSSLKVTHVLSLANWEKTIRKLWTLQLLQLHEKGGRLEFVLTLFMTELSWRRSINEDYSLGLKTATIPVLTLPLPHKSPALFAAAGVL